MPVYQGPDSCYAKREGMYVKRISKPGVDTIAEAAALAKLVLRDYKRGWTYDDNRGCKRIRMGKKLFRRRLYFIIYLAEVHGAGRRALKTIRYIVRYVEDNKRLPRGFADKAEKMIVKVGRKK